MRLIKGLSQPNGFSLAEVLVTIGIIGVISSLLIVGVPQLFNNKQTEEKALLSNSKQLLASFETQSIKNGLIPRELTPIRIVATSIKLSSSTPLTTAAAVPSNYVRKISSLSYPATMGVLPDKTRVFVSNQWSTPNNNPDYSTLFLVDTKGNVEQVTVYRNNSGKGSAVIGGENTYSTNASTSNGSSTGSTPITSGFNGPTFPAPISTTLKVAMMTRHYNSTVACWTSACTTPTRNWAEIYKAIDTYGSKATNAFGQAYTNAIDLFDAFLGTSELSETEVMNNLKNATRFTGYGAVENGGTANDDRSITVINNNGSKVDNISWAKFSEKATINDKPVSDFLKDFLPTSEINKIYKYTATTIANPKSASTWWAFVMAINELQGSSNFSVKYVDDSNPAYPIVYDMSAALGMSSPVKINLLKKDAELDSTNHFNIDIDGFVHDKSPAFKTSGGLGPDEAWIVLDRHNNGFFKNTFLDGDDVFGDHEGKFISGYEDLEAAFKNFIHVDNKQHRYIELKKPNWLEDYYQQFIRWVNLPHNAHPYYDLKLVTRAREVLPANQYLDKIYVDYWQVNEIDAKFANWIKQRSFVQWKGTQQFNQSADQWFRPVIYLTVMHSTTHQR